MELIKYTVREGNTLFGIAQFFQSSVADILQYNNIQNPSMIYPGQELTIPAGSNKANYYITRPGDTLWSIAQMHGTTVAELSRINGISNPNVIYPGQIIMVKA